MLRSYAILIIVFSVTTSVGQESSWQQALDNNLSLHFGPGEHVVEELQLPPRCEITAHPKAVIVNNGKPTLICRDHVFGVTIRGGRWSGPGPLLDATSNHSISKCVFDRMLVDNHIGFDCVAAVSNVWRECEFRCKSTALLFRSDRQSNNNRIRDCWFQAWELGPAISIQHGYHNVFDGITAEDAKGEFPGIKLGRKAYQTKVRAGYFEKISGGWLESVRRVDSVENYVHSSAK